MSQVSVVLKIPCFVYTQRSLELRRRHPPVPRHFADLTCSELTACDDKLFHLERGTEVSSLRDGHVLHALPDPNTVLVLKIHLLRTLRYVGVFSLLPKPIETPVATPIGSNTGSELSSPRQMRRIVVSPSPDSDSETYTDDNSLDDVREVEAALSLVEDEIDNTEDALTEWSRGSSSVGTSTSFTGQYSGATSVTPSSYVSEGYRTMTDAILDRERRVLSTISEHTENASRPNSFAQSGSGSRPNTHYSNNSGNRASANLEDRPSPVFHSRAATVPTGAPAIGRVLNVPGRRAGELIAFFEEKQTTPGRESPRLFGHARTLSAPMGPRSPAPRSPGPRSTSPYTTTMSPSMSTFGHTTSYGYGTTTGHGTSTYGYSSRPSSPTKSRTGSSLSASDPVTTMSSFMSPPVRGTTLSSDSRFVSSSSETFTQSRSGPSTYTSPGTTTSGTYSNTFTGFTTTATPTASSLRRPQTSPRSPLTSVRNIVAAWKERTPSLSKSIRSNTTSPSPTPGDGLFSVRRRASRGGALPRDRRIDETGRSTGAQSTIDASSGDALSTSGVLPTFDIAELGQFASAGGAQEVSSLFWTSNLISPLRRENESESISNVLLCYSH